MRCHQCESENPPGNAFCGGCGSRLALVCTRCGRNNAPDRSRCERCDLPLVAGGSPSPDREPKEPEPRSYTPRHLTEHILTSRYALQGERKLVTVLFADVKGSLSLAERVDPEQWHRIMDRFFVILSNGIHRFGGTINQYAGDGIMALFGAPAAQEDHAQRACYAALCLTDELRDYARRLQREQGLDFAVRIGLNSGEVVVGAIGEKLRLDYTAQGHAVGLAARMEQIAEPGRIYLTGQTAALVSGLFDLEDLGEVNVKGVSEPTRAFALRGIGRFRTRLDVARAHRMSRFVGRSEEFATLATALNGALEGHGRVVGVAGEAGVGKTRLCLELVQHCRDRGVTVLEAHCPAHGESVPLLPIRQLLRAAFGVSDGDGAESSRKQIAGELLALGGVFQEMLPLVFEFLEVPDPDLPPPALDSEWRQARLFNFIRRFVQARSAAEPTVLLIDDLHWIDSQSNAFLAEMVEALGWTRTFLLVNFRPQHHAEWMDASYYQQLDLSPLRGEAVHALLGDLLGHDPQTADLRELISERTQGNPFFIEEVVQSLFDHGALVRDEAPKRRHGGTRSRRASGAIAVSGGVRLTRPVTEIDIPATVQVLLAARIDRLPEREKLVLQTAAVIGKTFARDVLARVLSTQPDPDASSTPWCAVNDAELTESLDRLEAADFIRPDPVRPDADFTFKHPLTQAVAYGSQLTEARMRLHATVARAIEELHTDELGQKAALLAHHWEAAQMRFEAARWRRRAALRVTNIQLRGRRQRPQ